MLTQTGQQRLVPSEVVKALLCFMNQESIDAGSDLFVARLLQMKTSDPSSAELLSGFTFSDNDGSPFCEELHDALFGLVWGGVLEQESEETYSFKTSEVKTRIQERFRSTLDDGAVAIIQATAQKLQT